jgi:hypothetical protein
MKMPLARLLVASTCFQVTAFQGSLSWRLPARPTPSLRLQKTDAEWRLELTPEAYNVLRREGTEAPWR